MFGTLNGYAYQRFDWPQIIKSVEALEQNNNGLKPVSEEAIDAAEYKAQNAHYEKLKKNAADASGDDLKLFREELNADDQVAFDAFRGSYHKKMKNINHTSYSFNFNDLLSKSRLCKVSFTFRSMVDVYVNIYHGIYVLLIQNKVVLSLLRLVTM